MGTPQQFRCRTSSWSAMSPDLAMLLTDLPPCCTTFTVTAASAHWVLDRGRLTTRRGAPPNSAQRVLLLEAAGADTGSPVQTVREAQACWYLAGAAAMCAAATLVDAAAVDTAVTIATSKPQAVLRFLPPPPAALWDTPSWEDAARRLHAAGAARDRRVLERFAPRCFPACFPAPSASSSVGIIAALTVTPRQRARIAGVASSMLS